MDFLLPPLCLSCEKRVTEPHTFCAECWKALHFVAAPYCERCGAPFDLPVEKGTLCGTCLHKEPPYAKARSALIYDEASRPLILRFKHSDTLHLAPAFAGWMVAAGQDFWGEVDLIVPVPVHRWRLLKRRYNQAALLAQAIGKRLGKPVLVDGLVRSRATESQGHKDWKERHKNVAGAFRAPSPAALRAKRIVLVDDVVASGATVESCVRTLLQAGAGCVFVVTLARSRLAT